MVSGVKNSCWLRSLSISGPTMGTSSMPAPLEASSEIAPAGAPLTKKNASRPPSFSLSPAWLGLRYSALMSLSVMPKAPRIRRTSTSVPEPGSSIETRLPRRSATVLMPEPLRATR
ncbi:Uncharacterised protein [Bordetella pertussis]|nr:Uncharacterised protein [Bordetella pertussis]